MIGGGLALLQTAVRPCNSILGPIESAAQRIAMMGICNKVAGILAPLLIGTVVLHGIGDLSTQVAVADTTEQAQPLNDFAARIHAPYLALAGVLVLLAVAILLSPLPELRTSEANAERGGVGAAGKRSIFQFPHLWLGVLCLFVYVRGRGSVGGRCDRHLRQRLRPAAGPDQDVHLVHSGRDAAGLSGGSGGDPALHLAGALPQRVRGAGVLLAVGALLTHGYASVGFVAALGFANAMMWPAIFPLAIKSLGRFTGTGWALLIMGIAGGALIPRLFVVLKQHYDFQRVFAAVAIPCYLYILYYALHGHRAGMK